MRNLTDWREVVSLPVIARKMGKWSSAGLEKVLTESIALCVSECLEENGGIICTTLSGGLDSSLCLAKIREIVGPDVLIHTFTTGGSEKHPDVQFSRDVSLLFGTIHHELIPSTDEIRKAKKEMSSKWKDEAREHSDGDVAVFLTYQNIARHDFKCVIAHDGIDELLGGYWEHRKHKDGQMKAEAFQSIWKRLEDGHLLPLERKAHHFEIRVVLPYLQKDVVEYISRIPLNSRTKFEESKIPLRAIARKYPLEEVIERRKMGFCSALDEE
jgi:asparagine synthetase B (glutamine-hydrolysing)